MAFTVFTYNQAIEIANGTVEEATDWKARLFNYIVGLIGDKGILIGGTLILAYLIYKTWTRFSNPPNQIKLLPPNA